MKIADPENPTPQEAAAFMRLVDERVIACASEIMRETGVSARFVFAEIVGSATTHLRGFEFTHRHATEGPGA